MSVIVAGTFVLSGVESHVNADNPLICYHNVLDEPSDLTASSENTDFPASNLVNPATDLLWKGASAALTTVDVANDGVTQIDYVAIAGHNFNSAGISVKVQVDVGAGYVDRTVAQIPNDDGPIIFRLPVISSVVSVRIHMAAGSAPPEMAVVYVGRSTILQRRIYVGHTPITMGRSVAVANGISENGNYLGAVIVGQVYETSINLENLTASWYRTNLDPFIAVCKYTPAFFAWRPSTYPNEVAYAWVTNDPRPENQRSNGMMSISLDLRGIV
jgi:hypothetical protein